MRIDAHQHFWNYTPAQYPWIQNSWPIRRSFGPQDLAPCLHAKKLQGSIAVQARQTLEESRWLLQLAGNHPSILGVVGWVDLCHERLDEQLAGLGSHPKFVGVRHVVQDEPDDAFILRNDFKRGIAQLRAFDLVYDILVFPKQLPAAIELVATFPEQPFVLDHLAKPEIRSGKLSPWREQIRELAQAGNVSCKVSGMITEANWTSWRSDEFRPYLDVVVEAFGWERLMYGSDWPVCLLAGTYDQVFELVAGYLGQSNPKVERGFFGETAARVYGLKA